MENSITGGKTKKIISEKQRAALIRAREGLKTKRELKKEEDKLAFNEITHIDPKDFKLNEKTDDIVFISSREEETGVKEKIALSAPEFKVKWFTKLDYNGDKEIGNEFPAYCFPSQIKDLEEEERSINREIESGMISGKALMSSKSRLEKVRNKLAVIEEGTPTFNGRVKDEVWKSFNNLRQGIKEAKFTYDECYHNTELATEEARRMVSPCVKIPDEITYSFVKERGYPIKDGKISREHASIIAITMAKRFGELPKIDYRDR